jgi:hypothetical protein
MTSRFGVSPGADAWMRPPGGWDGAGRRIALVSGRTWAPAVVVPATIKATAAKRKRIDKLP